MFLPSSQSFRMAVLAIYHGFYLDCMCYLTLNSSTKLKIDFARQLLQLYLYKQPGSDDKTRLLQCAEILLMVVKAT